MAVLERLDIQPSIQKTRVVDAPEQGFHFLGFHIAWRTSHRSGKGYPHIELSKRAEQGIKDRVKELTARRRTPVALTDRIGEVSRLLPGWSGYFHYRNCSTVPGRVKTHAAERVRTQLRRRHKLELWSILVYDLGGQSLIKRLPVAPLRHPVGRQAPECRLRNVPRRATRLPSREHECVARSWPPPR